MWCAGLRKYVHNIDTRIFEFKLSKMPPARAKADTGSRRSLPFKPPSRVSNGGLSTDQSSRAKSQARRTSGMSESQTISANTTIISSDFEDEEEDDSLEETGEQSYLTTKAN